MSVRLWISPEASDKEENGVEKLGLNGVILDKKVTLADFNHTIHT